jgi:copper(I)-binding protein
VIPKKGTTMRFSLRRLTVTTAMVALAALGAAACGDDGSGSGSSAAPTVTGAWARTSASMATAGAAYMEIKGGSSADALVAASVPADIATKAEIHETVMGGSGSATTMAHSMSGGATMASTTMAMGSGSMGSGSTGSSSAGGMMAMRPVDKIAIPAGKTVSLAPGGYHVMLLQLKNPLTTGQKFTLTLTFEKAGKVDVPVEVRAS